MKKIFKKNQIIITALAVMIAAAGYISYSDAQLKGKKDKTAKTETSSEAEYGSGSAGYGKSGS